MDEYLIIDWSILDTAGDNPFQAMFFLFLNGGWLVFVIFMIWATVKYWNEYKQNVFMTKKQWIVLAIDVPRVSEQGPKAAENMFAYLAGAHSPSTWTEKWLVGKTQDTISCEIISIDGHVQFLIRTTRPMRDLVEASIYAQYPDAEITEVEDYSRKVPVEYPDDEWDLFGFELVTVQKDFYPLKTYTYFEDKLSMEFKDPLASMLESFSRINRGEQIWFQIVLTPVAQADFSKNAQLAIKKLTGEKVEAKKTFLDKVIDLPLNAGNLVLEQVIGSTTASAKKADEKMPILFRLTPGQRNIIEAIENKASKIVYRCKIRFVYVAKKEVMSKPRVVNPFVGAIKQFNTNDMQSLKPETKKVGISGALWFFKNSRNNGRKTRLIKAYRNRSDWSGMPGFHLSTEELASLWHFPHSISVKAPQLKKTEAKRSEPPANIPFA